MLLPAKVSFRRTVALLVATAVFSSASAAAQSALRMKGNTISLETRKADQVRKVAAPAKGDSKAVRGVGANPIAGLINWLESIPIDNSEDRRGFLRCPSGTAQRMDSKYWLRIEVEGYTNSPIPRVFTRLFSPRECSLYQRLPKPLVMEYVRRAMEAVREAAGRKKRLDLWFKSTVTGPENEIELPPIAFGSPKPIPKSVVIWDLATEPEPPSKEEFLRRIGSDTQQGASKPPPLWGK